MLDDKTLIDAYLLPQLHIVDNLGYANSRGRVETYITAGLPNIPYLVDHDIATVGGLVYAAIPTQFWTCFPIPSDENFDVYE